MTRQFTHRIDSILFVLRTKNTMETIDAIVIHMVRLFQAVVLVFMRTEKRRCQFLYLNLHIACPYHRIRVRAIFSLTYQKLDNRRMDGFYE